MIALGGLTIIKSHGAAIFQPKKISRVAKS